MQVLPLAAIVLVLVSGCASPADLDGELVLPDEDGILASRHTRVAFGAGVTLGGADAPQHASAESGQPGQLFLQVSPHATAIVAELVGPSAHGRVLLHAIPPAAAQGSPLLVDGQTLYAEQDATGSARIVIRDPVPGRWAFDVHADGLALAFVGDLYATSLCTMESGADPAGFTAVPHE